MKKILLFLSFLLMSIGMWGATVEFTPSNSGGMSSTAGNISGTKNGITISISNGVNNGNDIRVYKSATMTITSTVGNITNITFTYIGSNNGGWATSYTPNTSSWTSPTASGTQARCTRIVVTYSGSSPTTYTVTYNANGGTGTMSDTNSPYNANATVTVKSNTFTAPIGKEFDKWNTNSLGTGTNYNPGATFTISSNTTLYAQWADIPIIKTYYETTLDDINENDTVIFVRTSGTPYAISNNNGTSNPPSPVQVSINSTTCQTDATNIQWQIVKLSTDTFLFRKLNDINNHLYCSNTNNGVRVGNTASDSIFTIKDGYLYHITTSRYIGIYSNQDWRCYTSINSNIENQTFRFYRIIGETIDVDTVTLPVDTIKLHVGETFELTPTIVPSNATNKNVIWMSTMPTVATVDNGVVTGVAEGVAGVLAIAEDNYKHAQCVVIVLGMPNIDVIEWNPDWLKIDIENFTAVTATLEDQNIQAEIKENLATELFFSKYFEAEGSIKLLGIYNGTKNSIDLSNYSIKVAQGTKVTTWGGSSGEFVYDLTNLSSIEPSEEIILISYTNSGTDTTIINCILNDDSEGLNYQKVGAGELIHGTKGNLLQFSGDDAVGLFKNDVLIDIIGAGTTTAANVDSVTTNKTGTYLGHYHDDYCWIATNDVDTLSTNLCLLIRKSSVHNGENAVANNTLTFKTLSTEWIGKQVSKDTFSTCHNFEYVGTFDYAEHYVGFDTIYTDIPIPGKADDGFYRIDIPELDTLSCTNLKITVKDVSDKTLEKVVKIPIMIKTNTTTNSEYFNKKECDECDVIILPSKKLTVYGTSSENRDIKLYEGSILDVPTGTKYTVNSLSLRRNNDSVSALQLEGTLDLNKLYFDLYITPDDWHYITLPDSFSLSTITFTNGSHPKYSEDFIVKYYDGKYRSEHLKGGWKTASEYKKFGPGDGVIFATSEDYARKEYRFEINKDILNSEKNSTKTSGHMQAWGCENTELKPNHKGWNLIGNPYMSYIETDIVDPIRIGYLYEEKISGSWDGQWLLDSTSTKGRLRYAVIPSNAPEDADAGGYKSVVLDEVELKPFTCFFVQISGTNENEHQTLLFSSSERVNRSPIRKINYETAEDDELFLRVRVDKWKTGCFISKKFNEEYEPGDDLESNYPIYQNIGGYKLLYSAINDSIIESGVLINTPNGKLFLDPKVNINNFEYIYAMCDENWIDLLHGETSEITNGSFILQAKRKIKNTTTGINMVKPTNAIYKFMDGTNVYINKQGNIFSILGEKIN